MAPIRALQGIGVLTQLLATIVLDLDPLSIHTEDLSIIQHLVHTHAVSVLYIDWQTDF